MRGKSNSLHLWMPTGAAAMLWHLCFLACYVRHFFTASQIGTLHNYNVQSSAQIRVTGPRLWESRQQRWTYLPLRACHNLLGSRPTWEFPKMRNPKIDPNIL